jgi:Flp pilus assembly pilin Flp
MIVVELAVLAVLLAVIVGCALSAFSDALDEALRDRPSRVEWR